MSLFPRRSKRRPRRSADDRSDLPLDHGLLLLLAAFALACAVLIMSRASLAVAAAKPASPRLIAPTDGSGERTLPTFSWAKAKRATRYEFQLAADDRFESIVLGPRRGSFKTRNTFATVDGTLADRRYFWRVRGLTASGKSGRWSRVRSIAKTWGTAPELLGPPDGETVRAGSDALVLRWAPVDNAYKYFVTIATDESLAQTVIGGRDGGVTTSGTSFALPTRLASSDKPYYWAVTPLDASEHRGRRSAVGSFKWSWPTSTATSIRDASDSWPNFNPDSGLYDGYSPFFLRRSFEAPAHRVLAAADGAIHVLDPELRWDPIAGASSYEVEVSHSEDFAAGSKMCCKAPVSATSLFPPNVLANNRYHWRVRGLDSDGNAGEWHAGPVFQKDFDLLEKAGGARLPSIRNLRLVQHASDPGGSSPDGTPIRRVPIVTWDPVVGASSYEVQVVPRTSAGCNWTSQVRWDVVTAATAWTPLSPVWNRQRPGGISYPRVARDLTTLLSGSTYCVRVLAQSDRNVDRGAVVSNWTQLGGTGGVGFTYQAPTSSAASVLRPAAASDYLTPRSDAETSSCSPDPGRAPAPPGSPERPESPERRDCTRLPLFTWKPIPGAGSYFVVVAKDASFTEIRDLALTQVPAYAPRDGVKPWTYPDDTTPYYWAVVPAMDSNGNNAPFAPLEGARQLFRKRSQPPIGRSPGSRQSIQGQPTFGWTPAEGARTYTLQVATDPNFADLVENAVTDSTGFTSSSTYPADQALHWRVRANDENKLGLRWSDSYTFQRELEVPVPNPGNATDGEGIPVLSWAPVQGAVSYNLRVEQVDGTKRNFTMNSTAFTPVAFYGTGVWRWQVRANFPARGGVVSGGYSPMVPFTRRIATPSGLRTRRVRGGIALSWSAARMVRRYRVEIAAEESFDNVIEYVTTENTGFAPKMLRAAYDAGGSLFWRVAAVDEGNNQGGWATARLSQDQKMRVRLTRRGAQTVRVKVTGRGRRAIKGALLRVTGRGLRPIRRRTGRRGTLTVRLRGAKRGNVVFRVEKRGYVPAVKRLRLR